MKEELLLKQKEKERIKKINWSIKWFK